ncbi:MAG TPA: TlyA family RNA methyltransferase [Bacillota bacterium]|nr:TlyA family RNA methyltransferase [Bacillota bacterium]
MAKQRLDTLLVEQGFLPTREKAKTTIMAGLVFVANQRVDKPGALVPVDAEIRVQGAAIPYVSRGGLKLAKAIQAFSLSLMDKVVLDIGASTGGFTDCALQEGATRVFAVDVGYGQLAWKLRQDPRVVSLERTNIRYLEADKLDAVPDLATIDASFISLTLVLPKATELIRPGGEIVALIKPQFEAGRDKVGKKGVVRSPQVHIEVIEKVIAFAESLGLQVVGLDFSPITGPEGNIEYLLYLRTPGEATPIQDSNRDSWSQVISGMVRSAHSSL